mmetsp:Transcript_31940/g.51575  ORF Transcript_31940/g.51575 Transcript_31940/m.51575 type:complete len:296 (-) Transcript_31940:1194-2081(-)
MAGSDAVNSNSPEADAILKVLNVTAPLNYEDITTAAAAGDSAKVKELVFKARETRSRMDHFPDALTAAVRNGHVDAVSLLGFPDARYWVAEKVNSRSMVRWVVGRMKGKTPYEQLIRTAKMGTLNACFLFAKAALDASHSAQLPSDKEALEKLSQDCIDLSVKLMDEYNRTCLHRAAEGDGQAQVELLLTLEFQIGSKTVLDMANELSATAFVNHPLVSTYMELYKGEESKLHEKDGAGDRSCWILCFVALLSIAVAFFLLYRGLVKDSIDGVPFQGQDLFSKPQHPKKLDLDKF